MRKIIILLFGLLFFIACKNPDTKNTGLFVHDKAKWTYAIYMAADNNLERFALKNIRELKQNLIYDDVNFIVLLDRANGYDKTEKNWTDTKILELHGDTEISDDFVVELGEQDTSNITCLEEFLDFVGRYYPSEYFALNIWSHGFGVYPECKIKTISRSFVQDYASGYSVENAFSILEFSQFLRDFNKLKKIDILQFDCCLMQMIEILWQLKDCADYIIGSEAELAGAGSNYDRLPDTLKKSQTVRECAVNIVEDFKEKYKNSLISSTFAACDMSKFENFQKDLNHFISDFANDNSVDFAKIKNIREEQFSYNSTYIEYLDFQSFVSLFDYKMSEAENSLLQTLSKSYSEIILNSFVSNSYTENLTGFGINIPYNEKLWSYYNQKSELYLDIYNETNLGTIITKIVFPEGQN
ncbi:MAG: hypothetical protein K6E78_06530 [Treponema sp.]|nr:hypothetical protein [Treponema sp.]